MRPSPIHNPRPCYPGKALAILSCALALLASHPLTAQVIHPQTPAAVRSLADTRTPPSAHATAPARNPAVPAVATSARPARTDLRRSPAMAPVGSVAFLTAVQHLAWLLLSELPPRFSPEFQWVLEPLPVASLELPQSARRVSFTFPAPPPLAAERRFVLRHCLLAPPLA